MHSEKRESNPFLKCQEKERGESMRGESENKRTEKFEVEERNDEVVAKYDERH